MFPNIALKLWVYFLTVFFVDLVFLSEMGCFFSFVSWWLFFPPYCYFSPCSPAVLWKVFTPHRASDYYKTSYCMSQHQNSHLWMGAKEMVFSDTLYIEGKRNASSDFLGSYEEEGEHKPEVSDRCTCSTAIAENTK